MTATQTQEKQQTTQAQQPKVADNSKVPAKAAPAEAKEIVLRPPRLKFDPRIEEAFGVNRVMWKTLVEAIYPSAATTDAVVLALSYCKTRGLDPFKRPVHIVPMWSSLQGKMVETVWPGISELRITAHRTGEYAGCDEAETGPLITVDFEGKATRGQIKGQTRKRSVTFPEWCRLTLYRLVQGNRVRFVGPKVHWRQAYAKWADTDVPNDMWADRPDDQLEKCAEAAALRRAFPEELGGEYTAEEMAGREVDPPVVAQDVTPPTAGGPPPAAANEAGTDKPGAVTGAMVMEHGDQLAKQAEEEVAGLLTEIRQALQICKLPEAVDGVLETWLNKVGDLPRALMTAVEGVVEERKRELADEVAKREAARNAGADETTGEIPPAGDKQADPPAEKVRAKRQTKAEKAAAAAANETAGADETGAKDDAQAGAAAPAKDLPPKESNDALKARLRACKTVPDIDACFAEFVTPYLGTMAADEKTELEFILKQRKRLMGG